MGRKGSVFGWLNLFFGCFKRALGRVFFILNLRTGKGGTTDPEPGLYGLDSGVRVELKAVPDEEYFFSGWEGDASGRENPIAILMENEKTIFDWIIIISVLSITILYILV